jgi:hypothetical protein
VTGKQRRAAKARELRHERRSSGLCTFCGKNRPEGDRLQCDRCKDRRAVYYHAKVAAGWCPCGAIITVGKRCTNCLRKSQESHYAMVAEVIGHYGGKCACCDISNPVHLTIDHINGGGNAHAREIGRGVALYRWLRREKFPAGFQVLCANCNHGRARNGGICPHHGTQPYDLSTATRKSRRRATEQAIKIYGGKCVCGESNPLFLNLDHKDNNGAKHRRDIGSVMLAVWARQNGYPDILQLLCDNCNLAKERPFLINVYDRVVTSHHDHRKHRPRVGG